MKFSRDIIEGKVLNVQEALTRIETVESRRGTYDAQDIDDLQVLHLQRAIQASIDIANHLISMNGWPAAKSSSSAFVELHEHQIVSDEQLVVLKAMIGFRNVVVHRYGALDMSIVHDVVANRLDDLREFVATIQRTLLAHGEEE